MENWSALLDLRAIREKYGSPLYIFHPEQLKENIYDFIKLVHKPSNIAYPVKTCPSAPILQIMADEGLSADCASPSEISMALETGFTYNRIYYNSPELAEDVALSVLKAGGTLVLNDWKQLNQFISTEVINQGKIFLRWNPDVSEPDGLAKNVITAHGRRSSQFGSSSQEILSLSQQQISHVSGLHTHIGSRVKNLELFIDTVNKLHALVDKIYANTNHKITNLDIGGGLKSPMNHYDNCPSITDFTKVMNKVFRENVRYIIEPGNALSGNTIGLLTTVSALKTRGDGSHFAIMDAGSNQLLKYTISGVSPTVLNAAHLRMPSDGVDAVAGPLCFAGDILLPKTSIVGIKVGDPLFVQHCGAYCMALSNHFNGRSRPAMLTIDTERNNYLSQIAEALWITSPSYAGLRWEYDRSQEYIKDSIAVPVIDNIPVGIKSAKRTGKRTYCFIIECKQTLSMSEKTIFFEKLVNTVIASLHPELTLEDHNALLILPESQNYFNKGRAFPCYFSVGHIHSKGITVIFGTKETMFGFCRAPADA